MLAFTLGLLYPGAAVYPGIKVNNIWSEWRDTYSVRRHNYGMHLMVRWHLQNIDSPRAHDIPVKIGDFEVKEGHDWIGNHYYELLDVHGIRACDILERGSGSSVERFIVASTKGDNRALLHVGSFHVDIRVDALGHIPGKGFPSIVDMLPPDENWDPHPDGLGYSIGYTYLLIFKPGDAINVRTYRSNEAFSTIEWGNNNQFVVTNPPFSPKNK